MPRHRTRTNSPDMSSVVAVKDCLSKLDRQAAKIRGMVLHAPRQFREFAGWNSTQKIADKLRFMICLRWYWLKFRSEFKAAFTALNVLRGSVDASISATLDINFSKWDKPRRWESTYSYSNKGKNNRKHAADYQFTGCDPEIYEEYFRLCNHWHELCHQFDVDYGQTLQLIKDHPAFPQGQLSTYSGTHSDRTEVDAVKDSFYQQLRKIMPLNGRDAISLLLACQEGTFTHNDPEEKWLFGWAPSSHQYSNALQAMEHFLLPWTINHRCIEEYGRCPNVRRGRSLLRSSYFRPQDYHRLPPITEPRSLDHRWPHICHTTSQTLGHLRLDTGSTTEYCPSMVLYAYTHQEDVARWNALAYRIGGLKKREGFRNTVPTILTGRPEPLGGDAYIAPCLMRNQQSRRSDGNRGTTAGYVLFRTGWPDCYHLSDSPYVQVQLGESGCGRGPEIGQLDTPRLIALVDRASTQYFLHKRDEEERKLTLRQRQAKLLRKVRSMDFITPEQSISSGNCSAGTHQFIQVCRLPPSMQEKITGILLARYWRKAEYPQIDRFSAAVNVRLKEIEVEKAAERAKVDQATRDAFDAAAALMTVPLPTLDQIVMDPAANVRSTPDSATIAEMAAGLAINPAHPIMIERVDLPIEERIEEVVAQEQAIDFPVETPPAASPILVEDSHVDANPSSP